MNREIIDAQSIEFRYKCAVSHLVKQINACIQNISHHTAILELTAPREMDVRFYFLEDIEGKLAAHLKNSKEEIMNIASMMK